MALKPNAGRWWMPGFRSGAAYHEGIQIEFFQKLHKIEQNLVAEGGPESTNAEDESQRIKQTFEWPYIRTCLNNKSFFLTSFSFS